MQTVNEGGDVTFSDSLSWKLYLASHMKSDRNGERQLDREVRPF